MGAGGHSYAGDASAFTGAVSAEAGGDKGTYLRRPGTVYAPHLAVGGALVVPAGATYLHLWFPEYQRTWTSVTIGDGAVLGMRDPFHAGTMALGAGAKFRCTSVSTSAQMDISLDTQLELGVGAQLTCAEQSMHVTVAAPVNVAAASMAVATESSTSSLAVGLELRATAVTLESSATLSGARFVTIDADTYVPPASGTTIGCSHPCL